VVFGLVDGFLLYWDEVSRHHPPELLLSRLHGFPLLDLLASTKPENIRETEEASSPRHG
jgi:hypothetical protein